MCSWVMTVDSGSITQFTPVKPVIRISPSFFLSPSNILERFIAKKIPAEVLSLNWNSNGVDWESDGDAKEITLEIANNPFTIKETPIPSIDTTSEDLCKLALKHLNETLV